MKPLFNTHRREFLSASAKTGLCLLCGGVLSEMLSSCDTVEEGEPVIHLTEYPELLKAGGAIKKRYRKLNGGGPILIIRLSESGFAAYSALCTHKGVEVRLPRNGEIVCPNHGSRFSVMTGNVIDGQAIEPLQKFSTMYDRTTNTLTIS